MSFKIGDWVKDTGQNIPYQIKTQSVANAYNSDTSQVELWKPTKLEWCWFTIEMDEGDFEHPTLMQYGKQPKNIPWLVEPFTNSLPSWVIRK